MQTDGIKIDKRFPNIRMCTLTVNSNQIMHFVCELDYVITVIIIYAARTDESY